MQYHYKGGGGVQPPPVGANGNNAHINSPDSGIGDNHGNAVINTVNNAHFYYIYTFVNNREIVSQIDGVYSFQVMLLRDSTLITRMLIF